ncbi:hypothetical protein AB0A74_07075 [Saccharothrix sp. NPDC042600]|uniref:hypothetical protein n=1 Tax=Saccharothrix TaxID=2071 RepID=UPI0033E0070E|nr:hypothetical protein GCM10017745_30630 [Saccharothrix mutabilis subsp. capreolus]
MNGTGADATNARSDIFNFVVTVDGLRMAGGSAATLTECYRNAFRLAAILVTGWADAYVWTLTVHRDTVVIIPDRHADGTISAARTLGAIEDLFAELSSVRT